MGFNDRTDIESVLESPTPPPTAVPVIAPPRVFASAGETVFSTPYTDAVNDLGPPVAWWRMNDAGGATIVDTMGFADGVENNPAATLYQQPGLITEHDQFSQGAVDSAVSYMTAVIPAGVPLNGGVTLVWWTQVAPLAAFQNAMKIGTDGPSQAIFACFDNTGAGGTLVGAAPGMAGGAGTFSSTGMNMYAIVIDLEHTTTKFYKNGTLLATVNAVPSGTRVTAVGYGGGGSGGAHFGGKMDEIALFDKALGLSALQTLHNAGIATIDTTTTGVHGGGELIVGDAVAIGVPAPQGSPLAGTPVPTPAPTLASEGPVQGTPAPRIAGKQLVPPPAPPPPIISGQLSQPANAPQHMVPISTLRQG